MSRLSSDLDNVQQALSQVTNKRCIGDLLCGRADSSRNADRQSPALAIPILSSSRCWSLLCLAAQPQQAGEPRAAPESWPNHGHCPGAPFRPCCDQAFGMEDRFISDYRSSILALQKSKLRLAMLSALSDLSEDLTTGLRSSLSSAWEVILCCAITATG